MAYPGKNRIDFKALYSGKQTKEWCLSVNGENLNILADFIKETP